MTAARLRERLVTDLRAKGVLSSDAARDAFLTVPRERFVPALTAERGLEAVYSDEAIVTKRDPRGMPLSSSSQPALMARMLELLAPRPGDRVLEIGTGTGYNAALLAHMVGDRGRVRSVEVDAALARAARRALGQAGYRVSVRVADGRDGHSGAAPYDRIIVTACADEIPGAWVEQLTEGGRLVLPLRLDPDGAAIQLIPAFEREGDRLRSIGLTWGGFMPLHGGDGGWRPPPATLGANRSVRGQPTSLVSISGAGLERLPAAAARELLALTLAPPVPPRRQGVSDMSGTRPPLLLIYLLLRIPAERRVSLSQDGHLGVGIVDGRSRSLAVISLRSPWTGMVDRPDRRVRWRLDAYGGDTAAIQLDRLASEWQQLRRAHRTMLEVSGQDRAGAVRLRFAWKRA